MQHILASENTFRALDRTIAMHANHLSLILFDSKERGLRFAQADFVRNMPNPGDRSLLVTSETALGRARCAGPLTGRLGPATRSGNIWEPTTLAYVLKL